MPKRARAEEEKAEPDPDAKVSDDEDDEYEDKDDEAYVHVPKSWKQDEDSEDDDDEDDDDDEAYLEEGEEEGEEEEEDEEEEPKDDELLLPEAKKYTSTKLTVTLTRKTKESSLGFALADMGNFVTAVHKGGLAAKAGIEVGDKITEVNGKDCGIDSFASLLPKDKAQPIKLRVTRAVPVDE